MTRKQENVLRTALALSERRGELPALRTIAAACGLNLSTTHGYMTRLTKQGLLKAPENLKRHYTLTTAGAAFEKEEG